MDILDISSIIFIILTYTWYLKIYLVNVSASWRQFFLAVII